MIDSIQKGQLDQLQAEFRSLVLKMRDIRDAVEAGEVSAVAALKIVAKYEAMLVEARKQLEDKPQALLLEPIEELFRRARESFEKQLQ